MLEKFKKKYKSNVKIVPTEAPVAIKRVLSSVYNLNAILNIPSFDEMLEEL